ncbi:hypothetical protein QYM36_006886 [Artemia franciscana]|uniref:Uncharacterized protein n=1 Tax=Artemia franciscana TaxID=6661 RepID=A0AA88HVI4_ARTSF|nr:hypothetical protein QYM36_006886 [Artemia franciscana]
MMKVNMVKVRRIGKVKTIQISCGVFARRHITIDSWFVATVVTSGIMASASELQGFSNDVPELKSRLEYATGRRQPIKTTTKRVGATHVKPMASKPSVYGQQIAPTAKFAPQHNIAPQPPAYGQQRTTNATPITSLPSQQVAPAQPSLYGNQRPSTPSIQAPPPIASPKAPSIQAMQQAAYGTSGSSTFLPAAQAATASIPAKPVFQPTVPVPMVPQALPTSDDKHSCKLLIKAPSTIKQNYLVNLFNLLPGLIRFDKTTNCSRLPTEEIYLAVYNTRSEATYVREKLDGFGTNDGERLIVKFDGDKK